MTMIGLDSSMLCSLITESRVIFDKNDLFGVSNSLNGKLTAPGTWPDDIPALGSAAAPLNRSWDLASIKVSYEVMKRDL